MQRRIIISVNCFIKSHNDIYDVQSDPIATSHNLERENTETCRKHVTSSTKVYE